MLASKCEYPLDETFANAPNHPSHHFYDSFSLSFFLHFRYIVLILLVEGIPDTSGERCRGRQAIEKGAAHRYQVPFHLPIGKILKNHQISESNRRKMGCLGHVSISYSLYFFRNKTCEVYLWIRHSRCSPDCSRVTMTRLANLWCWPCSPKVPGFLVRYLKSRGFF